MTDIKNASANFWNDEEECNDDFVDSDFLRRRNCNINIFCRRGCRIFIRCGAGGFCVDSDCDDCDCE